MLLGHGRGAGVARCDRQRVDLRVLAERYQQRMFTGTGADHQDAHETSAYSALTAIHLTAECMV